MKKKEVKLECNNSSPGRLNCEVTGVSNCLLALFKPVYSTVDRS